MKELPKYYDNLELTLEEILTLCQRGVNDRKSGFHNVVLSTVDENNNPDARTVILRGFNSEEMTINIHSDGRAKKINYLKLNKKVCLVFYDDKKKIQIRIKGIANIKESLEKAWNKLSNWSKRCYLTSKAPGSESNKPSSGFPKEFESIAPDSVTSEKGLKNFAVISIKIERIEWLFLASQGHRRAIFKIDRKNSKINISSQWLIP